MREWMLVCPVCGYVFKDGVFYEYLTGRLGTYVRAELLGKGRWAGVMGVKIRGITGLRQWIASKTNSQRSTGEAMANYTERLAKALIGTGDFSEEEAKALAEAFVRHYRALRYGDGVRASLPKVETVVEVLDSITSGRSNAEGGRYDMAIASALRRAFTTTGVYKPLTRRALRLLRIAEPSEDLVELGIKYFEMIYKHLKETGKEARKYVTWIAIAATAMAATGGRPMAIKAVLVRNRLKKIIKELDLDKILENIESQNAENEIKL
jgi:polyhydroxyalkanoate synthesis regulator phasin